MISGFAQNDRLEDAKNLFDQMPVRNPSSWNAMLAAYCHHRDIFHTNLLFFAELPDRSTASWMCLILVNTYTGQVDRAGILVGTMPDHSSAAPCNAVLVSYVQLGRFDRATELFATMHAENWNFDETSFTCLLLGCSHGGDVSKARSIFQSVLFDFGKNTTKQHYCGMVDLLSRAGRGGDARELLSSMPYEPDAADWRSLLKDHNKGTDPGRTIDGAVSEILKPRDSQGYILLANLCK